MKVLKNFRSFNVTPQILNQILDFYNISREKFIQTYNLQPLIRVPELPFSSKVAFAVTYSVIFLLALFGNSLVLCTVRRERSRTVYTILIRSLAVSDLFITFFCIPFTLLQNIFINWIGGTFVCKMVPFVQTTAVTSCILAMTCIAVERYEGIVHPLKKHYLMTRGHIMLGFIWTVAIIVGSPMLYVQQFEVKYDFLYDIHYFCCLENWNSLSLQHAYTVFYMVALFVLPLMIMLLLYTRIVFELWMKKHVEDYSVLNLNQSKVSKTARKKKRAIVMMITVVVLFTICWAPFHVVHMLIEYNNLQDENDHVINIMISAVQAIGFFNSFNNPVVYTLLNETFRKACFSFVARYVHRARHNSIACAPKPTIAARQVGWLQDLHPKKKMKSENNNQLDNVELNWCEN
ncbi:pyroglutamylated RF-amide peptide receptor-like [Pristis pectinata]|uniref:pyroglutamylated RF-amide peptide receptor-like n=1 Tax=Pristis pectinata TaxID=685728 RepID=UPI00223E28B6|nr:pyroglutamylated RF-amide peptide receptor-like [Pristis pectinata]